jgi:glucose-6-phosphate 1-dehydrogenase
MISINNSTVSQPKPTVPFTLVVFGIMGDLNKRLLFPAVCNLGGAGLLDSNFHVIGLGVDELTNDAFHDRLKQDVKQFVLDPEAQKFGMSLVNTMDYIQGDFENAALYVQLKQQLEDLHQQKKASQNVLFYLAVPPSLFGPITTSLGAAGLLEQGDDGYFRRVVIEKPFGHDFDSTQQLNDTLLSVAKEEQLYRIDHFLGKETVQNIMALRFANGIFEPIWNRNYIDSVQITVSETLGVELRGNYYDRTGALRDMVPNHILQVLSLVAMESPISFDAADIQSEKEKVFHAIQRMKPEEVLKYAVRGQYNSGMMNKESVAAYRSEANVNPHSSTETFVALKLNINNWRWLGVPFYIRTGKRMQHRTSEVVIRFRSAPSVLFKDVSNFTIPNNLLRIHIQPDEGVSFRFAAKIPGPVMSLGDVDMSFQYKDYFGSSCSTGYETLLYDCINGDRTLFPSANLVAAGWQIVQPVLDVWGALTPRDFPNYSSGSWGPQEADDLLAAEGRAWIL